MVATDPAVALRIVGYALGTLGGVLVFIEFFQLPSYVDYNEQLGSYNVTASPRDAREYTWAGRVGALLVALAFALQFLAAFL